MKFMVLPVVALTLLPFVACVEENHVDCHPQVHLTIIHRDSTPSTIRFRDTHTSTSDKVSFDILDTVLALDTADTALNQIDYYWKGLDYCTFCGAYDYKLYLWITVEILKDSHIVDSFSYYPWDTTKVYQFSGNRTHRIYDTLHLPMSE